MYAFVRTSDRRILSYGEGYDVTSADPPPTGVEAVELDDAAAQRMLDAFSQPNGGVTLSADHTTATSLPIPPPDPAVVAAQTERTAAQTDLSAQYQAAMDRLTQIETATAPTNAQVVQAVRDMATIEKRVLRFLRAAYPNGAPG